MSNPSHQPDASAPLPADVLEAIARTAPVRAFGRHTVILSEGDPTDSLYVVLSGKVKFFLSDPNGREVVLGTAGPGEYFGEMALDEGPRSASVMTLEPSRFAVVPMSEIRAALAVHPDFALHLVRKLIRRARVLTENVRSLALMDVYGRVARLLLELAVERDGKWIVIERLTQQDIADRVGSSREMVGRIMKDLTAGGYVSIEGKRITVNRDPLGPR